jgi:two-component system response regulator AtoC
VPALKDRAGDVKLLSNFFVTNRGLNISDEAMLKLESYGWQGNVRKLENVLDRASILSSGVTIALENLPVDIAGVVSTPVTMAEGEVQNSFSISEVTAQLERRLIAETIAHCNGNKAKAAKLLKISACSLWYKLDQYKLK